MTDKLAPPYSLASGGDSGARRMRPSITMAPWPGGRTFTGLRSSSRSSGTLSTRAETRRITAISASRSAGRGPAIAIEETAGTQSGEHVCGIDVAHRGQAKGHIVEHSTSVPPRPHTTRGPNVGSVVTPTRASRPAGDLALQQNAVKPRPQLLHTLHQRVNSGGHSGGRVETHDDPPHVTFVQHIRTDDFRHQRIAETLGGGDGVGGSGLFGSRTRDAGGAQDGGQIIWWQPQGGSGTGSGRDRPRRAWPGAQRATG